MRLSKLFLVALIGFITVAGPSMANDSINTDTHNLAVKGYDVVAYFSLQDGAAPVAGDPAITASHEGATYQFASQANKDTFMAAPEKYAPQYGGWCAYGMANDAKASIEPDAWTIKNGKLYLNYNKGIMAKWRPEATEYIKEADANWAAKTAPQTKH